VHGYGKGVKQNLYLKGFALGFGRVPQSSVNRLSKSIEKVRKSVGPGLYRLFEEALPAERIALREGERQRCYDSRCTFWGMLSQTFRRSSLRDAVRELQAVDRLVGRRVRSSNTGPYSRARQRLSLETVEAVHHELYGQLESMQPEADKGRLLSVDASGVRLDDTQANRQAYGYAPGQKDGCGFPVMQLVALMDLDCGAVIDVAYSPNRDGESPLFEGTLMKYVRAGDTLLADRAYCGYHNFARLAQMGADCLIRLHGSRDTSALKNCDDAVVTWERPKWGNAPKHLSPEQWEAVPEELQVRLLRIHLQQKGFRPKEIIVATTLMELPSEEVFALYRRRWEIETGFAHIKTTMGMDHVHVKTPQMARKQVYLYLIANNLIRWLMLKSGGELQRISFKGTLDALQRWACEMTNMTRRGFSQLFEQMLEIIARDRVPDRPNRVEPRCIKARAKTYKYLTSPRHSCAVA